MTLAAKKLGLHQDKDAFGIATEQWRQALGSAKRDEIVKIRHAEITGDAARRIHVAGIADRVGCHFHAHGDEDYAVVEGRGTLHWGKATKSGNEFTIAWEEPIPVKTGDSFIIPEGYAHQLRNTGDGELIILFACPDSHLDDAADRFLVAAQN